VIGRLLALLSRHRSDRNSGAAMVEFAITAPILIIFLLGVADYSVLLNNAASLVAATRAGGEIARLNPNVTASQLTALGIFPTAATPNDPAPFCTCFDNTAVTCPASGAGSANPCSAKSDPRVLRYVTVSANQSFRPLFSWVTFVFPNSLTATTVVRTQ
jgi:Flp pilus assembly protein TadG